jgi:hypothetical protein
MPTGICTSNPRLARCRAALEEAGHAIIDANHDGTFVVDMPGTRRTVEAEAHEEAEAIAEVLDAVVGKDAVGVRWEIQADTGNTGQYHAIVTIDLSDDDGATEWRLR